jgi:hypothetical protein
VTDGRQVSKAARRAVVLVGGGFMISPEMKAAGKAGGYRGWALYMGGRAGVLGPAPTEVVTAALGFFEPGMVRTNWEAALGVRPLAETVQRYVEVCHLWGRNRFGGLDGVQGLAELLEAVAARVEPAGLPLFAAWHAVPLPDDPPARAIQLLHVLREHRGGAHLMAVRAVGLSPLEAVLAGKVGAPNAQFFGWPEPYPEIDDALRSRRIEVEQLTTEMVAPVYAGLTESEADDLVELLGAAEKRVAEWAA